MSYLIELLIALGVLGVLGAIVGCVLSLLTHEEAEEVPAAREEKNCGEPPHRMCAYSNADEDEPDKYTYVGVFDCEAGARLAGGRKENKAACLGLGSCERVCKLGAISTDSGVCKIDAKKCSACGECIKICPRGIIELREYEEIEEEVFDESEYFSIKLPEEEEAEEE